MSASGWGDWGNTLPPKYTHIDNIRMHTAVEHEPVCKHVGNRERAHEGVADTHWLGRYR